MSYDIFISTEEHTHSETYKMEMKRYGSTAGYNTSLRQNDLRSIWHKDSLYPRVVCPSTGSYNIIINQEHRM